MTNEELDQLEARIMEGAAGRWYISARSDELGLNVDTCVANPGWEEYWVLIWARPDVVEVSILERTEPGYCAAAYEMTPDQLIEYLHTLPRAIQEFGAVDVYDKIKG